MRGRHRIVPALLLLLAAGAGAPAPAQPKASPSQQAEAKPAQIDRNGGLILIRTALLALNHANETGNYTVLRDLSAPGFRDANNAARLGEIFASQRAQKLDLSGVAVLDPQLTLLPQIEPNGLLHMAGFFPSVPSQVNFELLFAPVDGRWRLFGVSVNVGSSAPAAPPAPVSTQTEPTVMPKPPAESKANATGAARRPERAKLPAKPTDQSERQPSPAPPAAQP